MPDISLPKDVRDSVLTELYRQIGELPWMTMPGRHKTRCYSEWIEDPSIGGELADYQTAEGMRVWLKDGPLKEYARAIEGAGPYARYTTRRLTPPNEFLRTLLGQEWHVDSTNIGEKPMHCMISNGHTERYVCWGGQRTYRDLLWAAINQAVRLRAVPLIVVYTFESEQVQKPQQKQQESLAEHCGVELAYVERHWEAHDPH
ncbi:hypothetical protein OHA18_02675 [Kribbella sp. NBC_00709]|uniref:hypothetical protein n=1 Tax=Kribbella sp. NBC_00709 TaxID=2975972 RepID=UPI002E2C3313|nr:hypothetical protein [Kribbella sp. NBC_00709]